MPPEPQVDRSFGQAVLTRAAEFLARDPKDMTREEAHELARALKAGRARSDAVIAEHQRKLDAADRIDAVLGPLWARWPGAPLAALLEVVPPDIVPLLAKDLVLCGYA